VHCPQWLETDADAVDAGARTCAEVRLVLDTGNVTTNSTTGQSGRPVFPTSFLYDAGDGHRGKDGAFTPAEPNTLAFWYQVRQFDRVDGLQYVSQQALETLGGARIVRVHDGTAVGTTLPPRNSSSALQNRIQVDASAPLQPS